MYRGPSQRRTRLRGELTPAARSLGLESLDELAKLLDQEPERALRRVPGRTTFEWPGSGAALGVVKRSETDLLRDRLHDLLHGRPRSPARREFENLVGLTAAGIPVPEPLAWLEQGARSLLLMAYVDHRETLRERLSHAAPRERRGLARSVGELSARLHAAGWYHRDWYLQHWILAGPPDAERLVLLDVGRARCERRPRRRWFWKDLGALLHSTPPQVTARDRLRCLAVYLDELGVRERAERRLWARAAEVRRARIAAHRPRHGETSEAG